MSKEKGLNFLKRVANYQEISRIRHGIEQASGLDTFPNSLLVTAANEQDGKSTLATTLSISIVMELKSPVLLVDFNTRHREFHHALFGDGRVAQRCRDGHYAVFNRHDRHPVLCLDRH